MDAREALRRYLEQRRDLGESDLVLDTMSVEEALALLGAPAGVRARRADQPAAATGRHEAAPAWGSASAPDAATRATTNDTINDTTGATTNASSATDWRSVIREAGGAPTDNKGQSRGPPPEKPMPHAPVPSASAADTIPPLPAPRGATDRSALEDVPAGIVIGSASRAARDDPASTLGTLQEIAATVEGCRRCPLYATAINPVPGAGNPDADFMIVGEAPGAREDEQGVPFVGQAGQLLTKIIGAIGLGREDVFIANVLKHRPPGNRNPMPEEVTACSPYLIRQIELVKPKVILALGTFAAQTLLETRLTIGKLRGQEHRYYGVPLIVTYHPAALLRNSAWKRPTWEDVQLARRILDRSGPTGA